MKEIIKNLLECLIRLLVVLIGFCGYVSIILN